MSAGNKSQVSILIRGIDAFTPEARQAIKSLEKLGRVTGDTNRRAGIFQRTLGFLTKQLFSLRGALGALIAGYGLKRLSQSFIQAASSAEMLRLRLTGVTGGSGDGLFEDLVKYAGQVPYQFEEILTSAVSVRGAIAKNNDEAVEYIKLIGDVAAFTGLTFDQTRQQMVRAFSAGIGSADLFRERGVTAMLGFKAGVTYSAEQTKEQILAQWRDVDSRFRGMAEGLAGTWTGIMSMIADKWFRFRNTVLHEDAFAQIKAGLNGFNEGFGRFIDDNEGKLRAIGRSIAGMVKTLTDFASGSALGALQALIDKFANVDFEKIGTVATVLIDGIGKDLKSVIDTWLLGLGEVLKAAKEIAFYMSGGSIKQGVANTQRGMSYFLKYPEAFVLDMLGTGQASKVFSGKNREFLRDQLMDEYPTPSPDSVFSFKDIPAIGATNTAQAIDEIRKILAQPRGGFDMPFGGIVSGIKGAWGQGTDWLNQNSAVSPVLRGMAPAVEAPPVDEWAALNQELEATVKAMTKISQKQKEAFGDEATAKWDLMAESATALAGTLQNNFANALVSLTDVTENGSEAFQNFFQGIIQGLIKLAAQLIATLAIAVALDAVIMGGGGAARMAAAVAQMGGFINSVQALGNVQFGSNGSVVNASNGNELVSGNGASRSVSAPVDFAPQRAASGGDTVINYYIDAIDTKSFEDRVRGASNVIVGVVGSATKTDTRLRSNIRGVR